MATGCNEARIGALSSVWRHMTTMERGESNRTYVGSAECASPEPLQPNTSEIRPCFDNLADHSEERNPPPTCFRRPLLFTGKP